LEVPLLAQDAQTLTPAAQARAYYRNVSIMLTVLAVPVWHFSGGQAIRLLLIGILSAAALEFFVPLLFRMKRVSFDFHSLFTGAAIAMMLPATAPLYLAVAGSAFAVLIAKLPLGGTVKAPFVPAAAGFAFLCVCFPQAVFRYPAVPIRGDEWQQGTSLAFLLQSDRSVLLNQSEVLKIIIGEIAGPLGATCTFVILGCALAALMFRPRMVSGQLGYLLSCAALAFLFPRGQNGRLISIFLELSAGMLVFVAVFLLPDLVTMPKTYGMQFFYGLFAGTLCMLFRYFGLYEEGACFALLAANAGWPLLESLLRRVPKRSGKRRGVVRP